MKNTYILILIFCLSSCSYLRKLPKENYYGFLYNFDRSFVNDTVYFHLKNPLQSPINIKLVKDSLNPTIDSSFGIIKLKELQDTIISIKYLNFNKTNTTQYMVRYGDFDHKVQTNKIAYPFTEGNKYKVIQ